METQIVCVLRKYHVRFAGGATIVIESEKELSEEDTKLLLEQDPEIREFVKHCKITNVLHPVNMKKFEPIKKVANLQEAKPKIELGKGGEKVLDVEKRIKCLLNMQGEFTSLGYIRSLAKDDCKISITQANYDINKVIDKLEKRGTDGRYTLYIVKGSEKSADNESGKGREEKIVIGVGQTERNPERHLSDVLLEDRKNSIMTAK